MSHLENTTPASATDDVRATAGDHRAIGWLTAICLGLVGVQPISAGFLLSGYDYASAMHTAGAAALQLVAAIQGVTAVVLWLRHLVTLRVAGHHVALVVLVLLEVWAGRNREYWLHVPLGVALLVWLRAHMARYQPA